MKFPSQIQFSPVNASSTSMEPRLPTFEEATGVVFGTPRLPSYGEGHKHRYHPYRRGLIAPDAIDRLMYTIYDDEYIQLVGIPPPLPSRGIPPLVPGPLVRRAPREDIERIMMERQARLGMVIMNEFIAGLHRAHHG